MTNITESQRLAYVKHHVESISDSSNAVAISFDKTWIGQFPKRAGVYAVFHGKRIIYVGESGSLKGRMQDLRRTENHTLRRQLGERNSVITVTTVQRTRAPSFRLRLKLY
jgi:hypothetical protein